MNGTVSMAGTGGKETRDLSRWPLKALQKETRKMLARHLTNPSSIVDVLEAINRYYPYFYIKTLCLFVDTGWHWISVPHLLFTDFYRIHLMSQTWYTTFKVRFTGKYSTLCIRWLCFLCRYLRPSRCTLTSYRFFKEIQSNRWLGADLEPDLFWMSGEIFCMCAQSCPTLTTTWTPWTVTPPGSSVHGISQARILEWVAISFSRGSSEPRDPTHVPGNSYTGKQILYHWATWERGNYLQPASTGSSKVLLDHQKSKRVP